MNAQAYIASRKRDFFALTREIGEAKKKNRVVIDLGYCKIHNTTVFMHNKEIRTHKSFTEVLAFILKEYW